MTRISRRDILRLLIGTTAATVAAACTGSSSPRENQSGVASQNAPQTGPGTRTIATVRVGAFESVADMWAIASERGYLQAQSLSLDLVPFSSGPDMVAPLAVGQIDVGRGAPSAGLFNAIARGLALKVVADGGSDTPGHGTTGLVVRQDLWDSGRVRTPADVKGMKIAFAGPGAGIQTSVDTFLETGGVTLEDLEVVTMPFSDMLTSMANGNLDLAIHIEPTRALVQQRGIGHVWLNSDQMLPGHVIGVVMYSPAFAADRSDVANRLMVAYLRAVRDYNDAFVKNDVALRAQLIDTFIRHSQLKDRAVYDRVIFTGLDPNGRVPRESLELDQDYFLSKGQQLQRIDFSPVLDSRFVESAVSELGPYASPTATARPAASAGQLS